MSDGEVQSLPTPIGTGDLAGLASEKIYSYLLSIAAITLGTDLNLAVYYCFFSRFQTVKVTNTSTTE